MRPCDIALQTIRDDPPRQRSVCRPNLHGPHIDRLVDRGGALGEVGTAEAGRHAGLGVGLEVAPEQVVGGARQRSAQRFGVSQPGASGARYSSRPARQGAAISLGSMAGATFSAFGPARAAPRCWASVAWPSSAPVTGLTHRVARPFSGSTRPSGARDQRTPHLIQPLVVILGHRRIGHQAGGLGAGDAGLQRRVLPRDRRLDQVDGGEPALRPSSLAISSANRRAVSWPPCSTPTSTKGRPWS